MKKVTFKSTKENYLKEKSGVKANTVRYIDAGDERFKLLEEWNEDNLFIVRIACNELKESFERMITDVTYLEEIIIISWDGNEGTKKDTL